MLRIFFNFLKKLRKVEKVEEVPDYNKIGASQALSVCDVRDKKVLVVGCNTGKDCTYFVEAGAQEVHGIDVVDGIGRDFIHPKVSYHQHTVESMPFIFDGTFDLVYSFATMEHVPDIQAAFFEMKRVTNSGGVIFSIAAPLWNSPYGHHKHNLFEQYPWIHLLLSPDEIKEWFRCNMQHADELEHIDTHVDYMLNDTYFNKVKAKHYIDTCLNLDMAIIKNELDMLPESSLTPEAIEKLVPEYGKDELLAVVHRFIGRKA